MKHCPADTNKDGFINEKNNIKYAGYFYDVETGLYYLNARFYDPETARFIQQDSVNDKVKVDEYGKLKNDKSVSGQAHHLNQNATYKEIIPTEKGISIKLEVTLLLSLEHHTIWFMNH